MWQLSFPHWSAGAVAALTLTLTAQANNLESYNVDLNRTSVSGISSGAFMAVQIHLAHSDIIQGVGVFAGGPYDCAEGSVQRALNVCMLGKADAQRSMQRTDAAFAAQAIDDPANLADDKMWLFSGYNDGVVRQATMDALYDYYAHYTDTGNVYYKDNTDAGHAQVTEDYGSSCDLTGGDFINDCDYDGAGLLLQHIYGQLQPRRQGTLSGHVLPFDQGDFLDNNPILSGMSTTGYVYVPASCAAGARCRVHIAFHGCLQYAGRIENAFYEHAGYNEWADTNDIIVLYPQTAATTFMPFNPKGCWDWWGYNSADYATQKGRQIAAVRAMLETLAGGAKDTEGDSNSVPAPPLQVTAIDSADDAVALIWTPNPDATGFNVYRAEGDGELRKINAEPVTGASYADAGLTPATDYVYAVSALSADGEGPRSPSVHITTAGEPPHCDPYYTDNVSHTVAGRAITNGILTFAKGSNDAMGLWNINVDSNLLWDGKVYRVGTCP